MSEATDILEIPILFKPELARQIGLGNKDQTRRVINRIRGLGKVTEFGRSDTPGYMWRMRDREHRWHEYRHEELMRRCPYGQPGDRLWVRETWRPILTGLKAGQIEFKADDPGASGLGFMPWKPNIHMPRKVCRYLLEVRSVSISQVQTISREDAIDEGIERISSVGPMRAMGWKDYAGGMGFFDPVDSFHSLWDATNMKRGLGWDVNPWVWVVRFNPFQIEFSHN